MSAPTTLEGWRALWMELDDAIRLQGQLDKTPIDEAHATCLATIAQLRQSAETLNDIARGRKTVSDTATIVLPDLSFLGNTTGCAAMPPATIVSIVR